MELFINSSNRLLIKVELRKGVGEVISATSRQTPNSQALLRLIQKVLRKAGVKKEQLTSIKVNNGPGSFTGLKVGVSVANALAMALNILVNGKDIETEINYQTVNPKFT